MAHADSRRHWMMVAVLSVAMLAGLVYMWRDYECCALEGFDPLLSDEHVEAELKKGGSQDLFRVATGIYVQSLSFESANDVQVTGRIWQRLPPGRTLPAGTQLGVLFPDAVSPHDGNLTPIYQNFVLPSGAVLNVWNFQVDLRQSFDYSAYPLDGKRIWIRFWTDDVENKLQLVPDLSAYTETGVETRMGISDSLVSGEWTVRHTFFGLEQIVYRTDFGRQSGVPGTTPRRPELWFYVVLERNFTDAFLVNLVPLFVTLGLLFGLMMTVSRDPSAADRLGFSTMSVFGACAGLFFISLVGHIQIREQFAGSQIVYIEYFYILSYVVLLFVSVFSFAITYSETPGDGWLMRHNGHNAKLFYWPTILFAILVLSMATLHYG
ncbi:MAG: hypothetical protein LJE68_13570 [Rhodobacter sp.]|nr:hypothetical protein [Rhodobacter sp.]